MLLKNAMYLISYQKKCLASTVLAIYSLYGWIVWFYYDSTHPSANEITQMSTEPLEPVASCGYVWLSLNFPYTDMQSGIGNKMSIHFPLPAQHMVQSSADIHVSLDGQFGYENVIVHTSEVLGTGSYGSVVRATLDHLPCAAKILHTVFFRDNDPGAADFAARFHQGCVILQGMKHPCIVQFLEWPRIPAAADPSS